MLLNVLLHWAPRLVSAAQEIEVWDPEILVAPLSFVERESPVYGVAASVTSGIPVGRVLGAYPSLKPKQVELAAFYFEANPQRGGPRQKTSLLSYEMARNAYRLRKGTFRIV